MSTNLDLLDLLLSPPESMAGCEAIADWLPAWRAEQARHRELGPFSAAIAAALRADRLAWAFFSAYQGAVQTAFPGRLPAGRIGAMAVNEADRRITEIATCLDAGTGGITLRGHKSWVFLGDGKPVVFLLARRGDGPGRGPGSLAMVQQELDAPGVTVMPGRAQSVVPEIAHVQAQFDDVSVAPAALLDGDGYADYAKPFRLREDLFVTGCALACLFSSGRAANWPAQWLQRAIAVIVGLERCAARDAREASTHVLSAGVLSLAGMLMREVDALWTDAQAAQRERWQRDRPLLEFARDARRARAAKAAAQFGLDAR